MNKMWFWALVALVCLALGCGKGEEGVTDKKARDLLLVK